MLFWGSSSATNNAYKRSITNEARFHPVHVSFVTIEYDKKSGTFKTLFRIFVDDFDLILNRKYGKEIKLSEGRWDDYYLKTINKYLLEHFKLIVDGKDKTKSLLNFSKREVKEKAIWLYYDFSYKVKSANFDIYNSLMTDLYPDQNNLLIFTYEGEQQGITFDINKTKEELRL